MDEVNRGNLSKIFGELLMLIENHKRGKELRLLYSDQQFSVLDNVYIIGMMKQTEVLPCFITHCAAGSLF
nr:hypothetical protein [Bacillus sp. 7705b]